jgi:hypothetical protein
MTEAEELRSVYQAAWNAALEKIRKRNRQPFIPYEAHDAGLRAVAAQALEDMADEGERFMFGVGEQKPADDEWNIAPRWYEIRRLRERAKMIRGGE